MQRDKIIIRTSLIGILANVFLAGFKAAAGWISGSIAVVLDAVNNLSDALSSVITIIGTKLAGRKPDRKHPYGHGRAEYLSAIIISVIVLYAGVTSLVESIKKILHPTTPDFSAVTLAIISVAIAVKLFLGRYVKRVGEKVNSDSLVASGRDAALDAAVSASTLAAALIFLIWGVNLEAWLGALISLVIIKPGIEMLRDSISEILGERIESAFSMEIKKTIVSFPEVNGAYDLILHSYGPETMIGSVHIEVPADMTAARLDALERDIAAKVFEEHRVILGGISVYSMNEDDDRAMAVLLDIRRRVMAHEGILQLHGFYLNEAEKTILFDIIIDYAIPDRVALYQRIVAEIEHAYPDYTLHVTLDVDVSD